MLTKRTNILFDEELWRFLVGLAKTEKSSVGDLVRRAVRETYDREERLSRIRLAMQNIRSIRKKQKGKIDYKELINYGRKY